jgi:tagatose 6-phosphate kinase
MILVVGLSPAWQRTLVFEEFSQGKVNRAAHVNETASGKGVNVARVASILGADVRLLTLAGGTRGTLLRENMERQPFGTRIVRVNAETRICQTLLAGAGATELVEESGALSSTEAKNVLRAFGAEARRAKLVVLTGTVPNGCGDDFYARLVHQSQLLGVPVLIDAQKAQLLNALRKQPLLVKINRDELSAATRVNCDQPSGVSRALCRLLKNGPQHAVITDGPNSVYVSAKPGQAPTMLKPPRVKTENPIGSGDAMMAGIAVALMRAKPVLEAVRLGIACGAANAMTAEPGCVRLADVRKLVKRLCSTPGNRVRIV